MDCRGSNQRIIDPGLSLSSLRLLVPPLRLLSAAMWQVLKQKDVMSYGVLEQLVLTVTESVPGLISHLQRAQLVLGLRARLILELCKGSSRGCVDTQAVQRCLENLRFTTINTAYQNADVERTESTFIALVQSLLKDPTERAYFYQEVFPVEYGSKFDDALHILLWELLSKLEKLFPVPDLKQTAVWLGSAPSSLEECVPATPEDLTLIYQHHKSTGLLKTPYGPSSSTAGSSIMSALSIPPSQKNTATAGLGAMHSYANLLANPVAFVEAGAAAEQYRVVTVYTEVEVGSEFTEEEVVVVESTGEKEETHVQAEEETRVPTEEEQLCEAQIEAMEEHAGEEEMEALSSHDAGAGESLGESTADVAKALDTLSKTFTLRKEALAPRCLILTRSGDASEGRGSEELAAFEGTTQKGIVLLDNEVADAAPSSLSGQEGKGTDMRFSEVEPTESTCETTVAETQQSDPPGPETEQSTPPGPGTELLASPSLETEQSAPPGLETEHSAPTGPEKEESACSGPETELSPSSESVRRSTRLEIKKSTRQRTLKATTSSKENVGKPKVNSTKVATASSVITIKGINTAEHGEMTSIIFTCSQCPFHNSDEDDGRPHIHVQNIPTDEYKALMDAKQDVDGFLPSPCDTDQIFTSIKLFPKGEHTLAHEGTAPTTDPPSLPPQARRKAALSCETCGKVFTRTSDVRRHQLTHTGERPFRCSQCERTFQHSWDLAKHEAKHHGAPVSFACRACASSFPNLRALAAHHKAQHPGDGDLPPICSICGRGGFPSAAELLEHKRTSHGASLRYVCQQCGEGFGTLRARSLHRQTHRVRRQFKCQHCDKTYTRRSDVKRHQASHTGERPHACGQCGKRFSLHFMLVKHLQTHTGERPFACAHCPKRFTLASILARHERMHTGEKPFLCSQCGKGFLSQGELSKHYRSHSDDRPYPCGQCGKRFKSKKTQRDHAASHAGARPYPCTHCGKHFTKPYALTRHNLIHTGERPFPCGYCDLAFRTPGEAQLHERVHTGERPYPCPTCELKFKSSSELARHRRCHSGQRPPRPARPSCERCGRAFASKAKLQRHMQLEHGEPLDSDTTMTE